LIFSFLICLHLPCFFHFWLLARSQSQELPPSGEAQEPKATKSLMVAVAQLDFDTEEVLVVHGSMSLAAAHMGGHASQISLCCNEKKASSYGYKWRRATFAEVDAAAAKSISKQGGAVAIGQKMKKQVQQKQ
jgi:hypothetical protein